MSIKFSRLEHKKNQTFEKLNFNMNQTYVFVLTKKVLKYFSFLITKLLS